MRPSLAAAVPAEYRDRVTGAVAVAGTATTCAAIDLALEPGDFARVEGHRLAIASLEAILHRLAALTTDERRHVVGLDPARAPTIVAGAIILLETLRAFGLDAVETSEHDILWGVALNAASSAELTNPRTPQMGGFWTFVRLLPTRCPVDTRPVGTGGRASRRRPPTHRPAAMPHQWRLPPLGPP